VSSQLADQRPAPARSDRDLEADRHYDPATDLSMCVTVRPGPALALGALLDADRDVTRAKGSLDITPHRFSERLLAIPGTPSPPFRPHAPPH
jgi:hypothetical protein